jgi:hypothetical protein
VQRDGQDIVSSVAGVTYAFSPESNMVAVELDDGDATPRVALVDLRLRAIVRRFGPGYVSRQAWLPGGSAFVYSGYRSVTDSERDIEPQLILADALSADALPTTMSQLPGGVGPAYAVSPAGDRIAAEVRGPRSAGVYLIDVSALKR